jgi:hypothetical protein
MFNKINKERIGEWGNRRMGEWENGSKKDDTYALYSLNNNVTSTV